MEIKKKASDFKSLTKVIPRAELQRVFLLSSNVWRSFDALDEKNKKVGAQISFDSILFKDNKADFIAKVRFEIKGVPEDSEKEVISIEAEFAVFYTIENRKELTKKDIEAFCDMNALYNAWPYAREFIQSITFRMELPPLILPLLKFIGPQKKEKKKN